MKQFLRAAALAVSLVMAGCLFAACGEEPPAQNGDPNENQNPNPKPDEIQAGQEGWYVLESKTVQGVDTTEEYLYNCMYLHDGAVSWYEIDYTGKTEQTGTFSAADGKVTVTIGVRPYEFNFSEGVMSFSGKVNRRNVTMSYRYDKDFVLPVAESGVSFTEELFGEDKNENFYNYCPSVIMEGDTIHVWYCSNEKSGNVTDFVGYRKGTLNASGKWEFGEKTLVLGPGDAGEWDSRHVCDPSVTKGAFAMNGETYSYVMAYLGCKTSNNCCNEVGIAVAKAPEGPWVKVESLNPVADWYNSAEYAADKWGYGQPSVISSDEAGKVILFYAKGTAKKTCTQVEEWDFSDLDNPVKIRSAEVREKNSVNSSGSQDCINNADFAYDAVNKRLWCIKEDFPYPTDSEINWIAKTNVLMYADLGDEGLGALFGDTVYDWNKSGVLQPTGKYVRAHNAGIVTNAYGRTVNAFRIPVFYTVSEAQSAYKDWYGYEQGWQWPALHTYRIHGTVFEI